MGFLEFVASLVSSAAWPAALCCVVYYVNDDIRSLLSNISKVKLYDFEAEFEQDIKSVEEDLSEDSVRSKITDAPIPVRLSKLIDVNPKLAVLEAWVNLESNVRQLSVKKFNNPAAWSFRRHLMALVKSGVIDPEIASASEELNSARNRIVHEKGYKLSKENASRYADLAQDISRYTDELLTSN